VAEDVSGRILSLPLYPAMTDDDVTDTIAVVTRPSHARGSAPLVAC